MLGTCLLVNINSLVVLYLLNTCLHPSLLTLGSAIFDIVSVLGIPSSFLNYYLNIKPLPHRPTGLSLGITSYPQH